MTGGNNVSCCTCSCENQDTCSCHNSDEKRLSKQRDDFESAVLSLAISYGVPILAICRGIFTYRNQLNFKTGMQLVAHHLGLSMSRKPGHIATRHKIDPLENSEYFDILNSYDTVNSYHVFSVLYIIHLNRDIVLNLKKTNLTSMMQPLK